MNKTSNLENLIERHKFRVLGLTWSYVERIPLYHFHPGSIALKVWVMGCPVDCEVCIESTVKMPIDVVDLKKIDTNILIDFLKRIRANILFFHGGETLLHWEWLKTIVREAKYKNIITGAKTSCTISEHILRDASNVLDILLVEIPLKIIENCRLIKDNLEVLKDSKAHIEVVVLINSKIGNNVISKLTGTLEVLDSEIPILIYPLLEYPYTTLTSLRRVIVSKKFKYVYIVDDPFYKFENTYCPKCNKLLIERHKRFLRKCFIEDHTCPSCKYTINIKGKCKPARSKISLFLGEEPLL